MKTLLVAVVLVLAVIVPLASAQAPSQLTYTLNAQVFFSCFVVDFCWFVALVSGIGYLL